MATVTNHDAIHLTDTPRKVLHRDDRRVGLTLQNQESAANIFVRTGGDGAQRSYLKLSPSGNFHQDILSPNQELWAYSDVGGAVLTVINKYVGA